MGDNMANFLKPLIFILFMIILGLSVNAFMIDQDDNIYVTAGNSVEGAFMIYEAGSINYTIKSDFEWISFDKTKYVNTLPSYRGKEISNNAFLVKYYINVPDNADISVHRTTIEVTDGQSTKYVNLKISVQSGFFKSLFQSLSRPNTWLYVFSVLGGLLLILLIITIPRGSKK